MAEYRINPFASGDQRIASGLSSLADAIAGAPQRRFEMEVGARTARADIENTDARTRAALAQAGASDALAGQRWADTALLNQKKAAVDKVMETWDLVRSGELTWQDGMAAMQGTVQAAELEPGDFAALLPAFGADMNDLDPYVYGRDGNFGNTRAGFMSEPENVVVDGEPRIVPRGLAFGLSPVLSETDARGFSYLNEFTPEQRENEFLGVTGTENVYDPVLGRNVVVSAGDAIGLEPEREMPKPGSGGLGTLGGTGLEAQYENRVQGLYSKAASGQPLSDAEMMQYQMAYSYLTEPKTQLRKGQDGLDYEVTIPGRQIPYPAPAELRGATLDARAGTQGQNIPQDPEMYLGPMPGDRAKLDRVMGVSTASTQPPTPVSAPAPVPAAPVQSTQRPQTPVELGPAPASGITVRPVEGMGTPGDKPLTEAQARFTQFGDRIDSGSAGLFALFGYDPVAGKFTTPNGKPWLPSWSEQLLADVADKTALTQWAFPYAADEKLEAYRTLVQQTLNPLIRADSGAAVPDTEYPRYYAQYIPRGGEEPATVKLKLDHLMVTEAAFRMAANDPEFKAAMQAGDAAMAAGDPARANQAYATAKTRLAAAKARIADEQGIAIPIYQNTPDGPVMVGIRPPQGGAAPAQPAAPAPSGTPGRAAGPDTITLPGGMTLQRLD